MRGIVPRQALELRIGALMVVLTLLGTAGCNKNAPEHKLFVRSTGQGVCQIVDADGNAEISVNRGDWVVWQNDFGTDMKIEFGPLKRLFGVLTAVSYANADPLRLQVRADAETGEHRYRHEAGTGQPGPGIIVNPPGGGG